VPDSAEPGGQVCGVRRYLPNRESLLRGRLAVRVIPPGGTCSEENFLGVVRLAVRTPARRSGSWQRLAARVPRQTVHYNPDGIMTPQMTS